MSGGSSHGDANLPCAHPPTRQAGGAHSALCRSLLEHDAFGTMADPAGAEAEVSLVGPPPTLSLQPQRQ